jgi:preprotein translocase subunit SecA
MDYLRAGIGLRAMGQRDPLSEYQREAYDMFAELVESVKRDAVRYLFRVELAQPKTEPQRVEANPTGGKPAKQAVSDKVGRNDPCPCGSGKKYKRCHGAA